MEPPGRPGPIRGRAGLKHEAGRWPRALGTSAMGLLMAVLGTTAFTWWAVGPLRLEPLIVLVVSAGYRLPLVLGFVVVMFLGYVADLISGGVMGLSMVVFTLIYVICQLARLKLDIASWPFQMLSVGVLTVLAHLLTAGGDFDRALLRAPGQPAPAAGGPGAHQRPYRPAVFRPQ